jgi:hypothetical protein
MNYLKQNAMPLLIGAAIGYYIAKKGGLKAATSKVTGTVQGAV